VVWPKSLNFYFFSKTLTPCIFVIVHISKKRQRKKILFFEALFAGERKAPTLESPCINYTCNFKTM